MQTQASQLRANHREVRTLFPDKPRWVEQVETAEERKSSDFDPVLTEILPTGPKSFPKDFIGDQSCECSRVELPADPINVEQLKDGKYVVRSSLGFAHSVRNATEGNYIYSAEREQERIR
jgi:hypothetical protein